MRILSPSISSLGGAEAPPLRGWLSRVRPLHACDHFAADIRRRLLVSIEVHRIRGATLRARAELRRVPEHLAQRHARRDDLRAAAILLRLDAAPARRQIAHHVAQIILWYDYLDAHDRLEQHRPGFLGRVL